MNIIDTIAPMINIFIRKSTSLSLLLNKNGIKNKLDKVSRKVKVSILDDIQSVNT